MFHTNILVTPTPLSGSVFSVYICISEHNWITSVPNRCVLSKKWAGQLISDRTKAKTRVCVFFTGLYFDLLEVAIYIIGWAITQWNHTPQWGGALSSYLEIQLVRRSQTRSFAGPAILRLRPVWLVAFRHWLIFRRKKGLGCVVSGIYGLLGWSEHMTFDHCDTMRIGNIGLICIIQ